jgi:ABC-2 type transport system permease protein
VRKLWLIWKREYLTRVRTKTFVVSTVFLPVLFVGIVGVTVLLAGRQQGRTPRIAIADWTGSLAPGILAHLRPETAESKPVCEVTKTLKGPNLGKDLDSEMRAEVRQGQLEGFLMIPANALSGGSAEFHTRNPGDFSLTNSIHQAVHEAVVENRLAQRGIRLQDFNEIIRDVDVKLVRITAAGESEEKGQTFVAAVIMAAILYTTLLMYGVFTMRSVLEEKTTRVMEILVSSARPSEILAGKILALASVAITQYLIWILSASLFTAYSRAIIARVSPAGKMPPLEIPTSTLAFLVVFFLTGYLLYASMYAAVGSLVSSEEDAQQLQWPVTLPLVASIILFNVIVQNPNSNLAVALSMVPFFSPVLMVFRIALQTPPLWQILLSLAILAASAAGIVYASAKIYRVGILMYGKRPSLVEVFRWLRYT